MLMAASRCVQAGSARLLEYASLGPELALSALLVGLTTTSILFCSHFHQIEGDTAAGKMSPLVRLGTQRGYEVRPLIVYTYKSSPWLLETGECVHTYSLS